MTEVTSVRRCIYQRFQIMLRPFRRPCRQQDLGMVQAGGHDGAELVRGQGCNKFQDGRVLFRPGVLQPQEQPQDLHPGESVRLCQAEALRAAADGQLNIFGDDSHVVFPSLMMFYEPSEY